jgi:MFS family permease
MMLSSEKSGIAKQYEDAPGSHVHSDVNNEVHGFTADETTLKKGYFRISFFLGTMLTTGLGLAAAVGGFGLAAPNLALINADIGPDPNITWVSLVYTLTLAIGLLLVGRSSDLFGRRVSWEVVYAPLWLTISSGSSRDPLLWPLSGALFTPASSSSSPGSSYSCSD